MEMNISNAAEAFASDPARNCAPFSPDPYSRGKRLAAILFPYHWRRAVARWFCHVFDVQCSGKQLSGLGATMWCQHQHGHDGPCHNFNGTVFRE